MRHVVGFFLLVPLVLLGCREDIKPAAPRDGGLECAQNERNIDGVCTFVCDRDTDCAEGQRCNLFTGVCVPDTRQPEPENPPVPCTTGGRRCSADNTSEEYCDENGVWVTVRTCEAGGFCKDDTCLKCEPGRATCKQNDPDTLLVCNGEGSDTFELDCAAGATCTGGICGECIEGETRCTPDGTGVQLCVRTTDQTFRLKWEDRGDESDGSCITNECVVENGTARCKPPSCYPGDQQCDGTTAQLVCNDQGEYVRQTCSSLPNFTANARCENERCVDECGSAAALNSYFGCDYWTAVQDNTVNAYFKGNTTSGQGTAQSEFSFVIANNSADPTVATITRHRNGTVETVASAPVPGKNDPVSKGLATVKVPWQSIGGSSAVTSVSGLQRYAYRIQTTRPVTVYQFNPLAPVKVTNQTCTPDPFYSVPISADCNSLAGYSAFNPNSWGSCESTSSGKRCHYYTYSNDASLLLPAHILGTSYVAMTNEHVSFAGNQNQAPKDNMAAHITIVGTEDGTQVRVRSSAKTTAGTGVTAMAKGEERTFTLNSYSVLQLATDNLGAQYISCVPDPYGSTDVACRVDNDLTGTIISTNKPVALFGGSACTIKPENAAACDHIEEMIFPFSTWGKQFVAAQSHPLRKQDNSFCSATQASPDMYKLVTGCPANSPECPNGTLITFTDPPAQADVLPPNRCETGTSLWENNCRLVGIKAMEFRLKKNNAGHQSLITATHPITVSQSFTGQGANNCGTSPVIQGDPSMILLPPVEQWRSSYTVLAAPGLRDNYLGITWDSALVAQILVDGAPLNLTQASVKTITNSTLRALNQRVADGTHTVEVIPKPGLNVIPGAGVTVYGFDRYVSYGYTGGLDLQQIVTTIDPGG